MKTAALLCLGLLLGAVLPATAGQPAMQAPATSGGSTPPASQGPTPTSAEEAQAGAAPLRVMVGKSILLNTAERLKRVSVTDPSVADAVVVSPTQVVINGKAPGEVSLVLWDQQERSRTFDLRVDVDVTNAAEEVKRVFPDEQIQVSASRNAVVLSGHVSTKEVAERASVLVGAFSKNVVNVLSFGPVGAQEILLEVKFAEVDRTALAQYGVNLFSTGAANTFGATSTQQHGPFSGSTVGSVTSDVTAGTAPPGSHATTGEIGRGNFHNPATFSTNDILNLFLFRADVNVGAIVKALQQKNVLQILAEPNLIAVNGKEASFLAGGEFPIPVVQGIGGTQTVTIQFKEFGVRLKFLPVVMPNGNMHMRVTPEVSTLDFTNALTISGFTIPALSTRRADTEFEVQDGQSFVIAGLLDNRVTNVAAKVPGLGNIPILGYFFRSKTLQKSKSELMVLVTARRISPSPVPQQLPKPALPYLDPGKFDVGKPGGAQ